MKTNLIKRIWRTAICCLVVSALAACASASRAGVTASPAAEPVKAVVYAPVKGTIVSIEKYGHADTNIKVDDLYAAGYALGDMLTVTFNNGFTFDAPLVPKYDVGRGEYLVRTEYGDGYIALCINYGDIAKTAGVGVGDGVVIAMKEKKAYLTQLEIRQLVSTDNRADYASDAVFANFREVSGGSIGKGVLYRGSHPTKTDWPRAPYASSLIEKAGVKTVVNMSDSAEELDGYLAPSNPYASTFYKGLRDSNSVVTLSMNLVFDDPAFTQKLLTGLRFMLNHPGPYYVHCNEGKDRTGFFCVLVEALAGADQEAIVRDYMESYINYYHIEQGTEKYNVIAADNVIPMLKIISGKDDLKGVNLAEAAQAYLLKNGMTDAEVLKLKSILR